MKINNLSKNKIKKSTTKRKSPVPTIIGIGIASLLIGAMVAFIVCYSYFPSKTKYKNMETEINKLKSESTPKDSIITTLKSEISSKDTIIADLNLNVSNKETEINKLKSDATLKDTDINNKELSILKLKTDLNNIQDKLKTLSLPNGSVQQIEKLEIQIKKSNDLLDQNKNEIKQLIHDKKLLDEKLKIFEEENKNLKIEKDKIYQDVLKLNEKTKENELNYNKQSLSLNQESDLSLKNFNNLSNNLLNIENQLKECEKTNYNLKSQIKNFENIISKSNQNSKIIDDSEIINTESIIKYQDNEKLEEFLKFKFDKI